MRPIGLHGCPEDFRESLTTPKATIPNIFHGLLFGSTLSMFLQNLKSVALPVPEIIGGTQKIWALLGYAHAPFSPKFLIGFYYRAMHFSAELGLAIAFRLSVCNVGGL